MRPLILSGLICWAGLVYGAVIHIPIKSSVVLKPNQAHSITIDATEPTEIGWKAVQSPPCTTNCVQATDVTGGNDAIATALGAAKKYTPAAGKISIEYKNISREPVTIDVYRVQRTCDAEACKFLEEGQKGRWLVYKVEEFKTIATSKDGGRTWTTAGVSDNIIEASWLALVSAVQLELLRNYAVENMAAPVTDYSWAV